MYFSILIISQGSLLLLYIYASTEKSMKLPLKNVLFCFPVFNLVFVSYFKSNNKS